MISTVAEVAPIVAPSAEHGATTGYFGVRGEQTVKIAPKWVNRAMPQRRPDCIVWMHNYGLHFSGNASYSPRFAPKRGGCSPQRGRIDGKDGP
ncbi:MAG: hypothetical protein ACLPSW_34190 [Roseiarcus sp.]